MRKCSGRLAGLACALLALSLMSPARSVAAPAASALGPEVEVSKPRDGYVGRMDVSPDHGPAGTPVTVTAEGLPPGQEFQVVWVTANGEWKVADAEYHGRDFTQVAYEIAKAKADQSGRLSREVHRAGGFRLLSTTSCCSRATASSPRSAIPST